MATTTNYSWSTPDDTALVKDGAAAIRSLGTAIDSTVFTNAGAAIAKATVDAKGDLIAGTADNTVARLAVGANDTVLTADSSTATGLKWAAPAVGLSYAIFRDEKSTSTQGGTFTAGAWRTRDLNTSQFNNITGASLATNQITLAAGTYLINAFAPAYKTNSHVARLYNITDSAVTLLGSSGYVTGTGDSSVVYSFVTGVFTIAATKVFEIQHQSALTQNSNGFGGASGFQTEVYTSITITKGGLI